MYSYRTPLGLPVRYTLESDTHIENEFLFGVYEWIFTNSVFAYLGNYYTKAASMGYPNHIIDSVPQKGLSHDQTTAYHCFAYLNFGSTRDAIPDPHGVTHPRDSIYYGLLKGKFLSYLLLPLFYLTCFMSLFVGFRVVKYTTYNEVFSFGGYTLQNKLSGELLWLLRYEAMKQNWLLRIVALPLKYMLKFGAKMRFGSVKAMVFAYFYNDMNHPILKNWSYEFK